jgi:hypothetical protein
VPGIVERKTFQVTLRTAHLTAGPIHSVKEPIPGTIPSKIDFLLQEIGMDSKLRRKTHIFLINLLNLRKLPDFSDVVAFPILTAEKMELPARSRIPFFLLRRANSLLRGKK